MSLGYEPMRPDVPPNTAEGKADWHLTDFSHRQDAAFQVIWWMTFPVHETFHWRRVFRVAGQ